MHQSLSSSVHRSAIASLGLSAAMAHAAEALAQAAMATVQEAPCVCAALPSCSVGYPAGPDLTQSWAGAATDPPQQKASGYG